MFFVYILFGLLLGLNIVYHSFKKIRKTTLFFIPPVIVFLLAVACTAYGLTMTNGWDGMTFGIIGFVILLSAMVGTVLIPILLRYDIRRLSKNIERSITVVIAL